VYVGDVVAAFLAAADRGRPGTWNIGTGAEVSVLGLVDIVAGIAGRGLAPRFAPARPGELQRSSPAVGRAATELGWRAVTRWRRASAGSTAGSRPERPTGPAASTSSH
jgi:UDP-glucose 4-epimerase